MKWNGIERDCLRGVWVNQAPAAARELPPRFNAQPRLSVTMQQAVPAKPEHAIDGHHNLYIHTIRPTHSRYRCSTIDSNCETISLRSSLGMDASKRRPCVVPSILPYVISADVPKTIVSLLPIPFSGFVSSVLEHIRALRLNPS